MYSLEGKKVWVAGHRGLVGSAVSRRLASENCEMVAVDRQAVDLTRQVEVEDFLAESRPDAIVIAAARVGGILANDTYPVDFLYENLMIETNIMKSAHETGVEKILFLGSSCIYPKMAAQPMREDSLLTGPLEPTNEAYAIAKIAGIRLAQAYRKQYGHDYISAMPTNLYGPGDNFDLNSSHVLPALIRKTHEAKRRGDEELVMWGTGTPRREFLHCDDCADALVFLLKSYSGHDHVNVGSGKDISILELTELVCKIVGFEGRIRHDLTKPDGMPRKLMDSTRLLDMGWKPTTALEDGIRSTYEWFKAREAEGLYQS
ncbi:GDP-L-fucose synthase [Hartmannibacter diazotrophicus]|uniref:GDP-L-fucose synthase n=1 Tax=Hartmannibacter diazotrophicus TaxID=1482074 RepID=A0A2C9D9M6_9HYPH|nr:GDP-L-fucose synthase [Hartmannibacter diazotrophicus]SON56997.1 GDP-L-fucose synthase [Hartmannibacter diazotrophicus]